MASQDYVGPHSKELNITCKMVLDPSQVKEKLSQPITNGAVAEIRRFLKSDSAAVAAVKSIDSSFESCNEDSLRRKILLIFDNIKKMRKNGSKKKENDYSIKPFTAPTSATDVQLKGSGLTEKDKDMIKEVKEKTKVVVQENRGLKREVNENLEEIDELTLTVEALEEKLHMTLGVMHNIQLKFKETMSKHSKDKEQLRRETNEWEQKFQDLSNTFDKLTQNHSDVQKKLSTYNVRNTNKRQKRLQNNYRRERKENEVLRERVNVLESEVQEKSEQVESSKSKVVELKNEKRNLQKRVSSLKKEKMNERERKSEDVVHNEAEIERLKNQIHEHMDRISELEEINILLESDTVKMFENGRYRDEVRECIMTLMTECNVSLKKVNRVISTVINNLTGKLPERLPSMAVRSRLYVEAKAVAHQQIVQAMLASSKPDEMLGSTLHSDATSKYFKHYQSFQVTTSEGQALSIGLSELGGSDSVSVMDSFKALVDDLAQTVHSSDDDKASKVKQLVGSITNTMSDQGAINPVFNKMLADLRSQFLPDIISNWDTLDEASQAQLGTLGHFFCKMHLVVNFASESDKCLHEFENNIIESGRNPHSFGSSESSAVRLVRTAAKAFTAHGSEKAGVASYWESFLSEKELTNKLVTFRSNRFNIIFYDAAALYYHWCHIQDFLNQWLSPNDLLKSIMFDVNEKLTKAGVRALGIIDKVVTGPMWRLFEKDGSILSLNPYLHRTMQKFQEWGSNAAPLLEGEQLFYDIDIHKDEVYEALFAETGDPELDSLTQMALEIVINAMLIILDRQAKDQLPDGKYFEPSPELSRQAAAVPKTNTISERDFGSLDLLVRMKPGASAVCLESIVLWSNNKTAAWLDSLGEEERAEALDLARRRAPELKERFQVRKRLIKEQKLRLLKEKQTKKQTKDENQRINKINLTNEITEMGGLWSDVDTLGTNIANRSSDDLKKAVYTQIKFHKDVLNSRGPRELFQKSKLKHTYTTDELVSNLQQIIEMNSVKNPHQQHSLVLKDETQVRAQLDSAKQAMTNKVMLARQKRSIAQQKDLLPIMLRSPSDLVGKKILHQCFDEGRNTQWYPGVVSRIHKNCPADPIKTKYVVSYDEVPADEYIFDLLKDLKKGDLIIQ